MSPSLTSPSSESLPWPNEGRLAGIDYGTVRIGLAICDPSRTWTSPLQTYLRRNEALDRKFFLELLERETIVGWVVGLPIHCDGQESQKSTEVRVFAAWLSEHTKCPIQFFDERFSTAQARRLLAQSELTPSSKKNRVDRVAAHLILEGFLEFTRQKMHYTPAPLDDSTELSDR